MHVLVVLTGYLNDLIFGVLAVVALRHWRRTRPAGSSWVVAAFAGLAMVAGISLVLPREVDGGPVVWVQKVLLVVLVLFPYFLYRFAGTLEAGKHRMDGAAGVLTGLVTVATLALPRIPPDDARPSWFALYIGLFLVQWTGLSSVVSARLWKGGRGKPTVARRRMQVLSVASVLVNLTFVVAATATSGDRDTAVKLLVHLLATGSALLFLTGFAPPAALRRMWRRPAEDVLRSAQLRLMAATSPGEVADHLLPHVAAMIGGGGAALVDGDGCFIGSYGVDPGIAAAGLDGPTPAPVRLPLEAGALLVWTIPQRPFFGQEELDLLSSLSVVTDLALARCRLLEEQRQREQRLAEAQRLAHVGSWEWDVVADRLTWSDELYRMFGLGPNELDPTYEGYLARIHPDDRAEVDTQVSSALSGTDDLGTEYRIVRPTGDIAWMRVHREVVRDGSGTPVLMRGTLHDITHAKQLEDELRQTTSRYRLLQVMATAANEAERVEEVLQVAVDEIRVHTGWRAGRVWRASTTGWLEPVPLPRPSAGAGAQAWRPACCSPVRRRGERSRPRRPPTARCSGRSPSPSSSAAG